MDKHSLYEKVRLFTEQFPYQYRDGVMEEIKEIFFQLQTEGKRGVKDFALFFDYQTNHYRVKVILEENNLASAQSIFLSFFGFVASAGATITARRETEQGMHYLFASFSEKGSGFCCEIDFLSEEADLPEEERQKDREGSLQEVGEPSSSQRPQPDVIWTFKMDAAAYFPPLAAQGIIYGVGNTGDLSAVDARQGTLRWRWQAQSQRHNITALSGVDQSMLAVSTSFRAQLNRSEATLSVLDSQTGRVLWSFPVPALQSIGFCPVLTLQDGIVYLSGTDRTGQPAGPHSLCLALDLQTGVQKWTADVGEYRGVTPPIVSDARVYLATFEVPRGHSFFGYLHALDAQTGREIWKHPFETRRIQESVVAGTEIFVAGTRFEVVDAATGMTQWSLPDVPSFRESALAVSDELVVISYERFPAGWGGPEIEKP
ncbi:MAG TPA: PQQ-binding-like beta-propeller repeat protein, partial [Ktedonobacteraceae bacterium]|nr:PQQ-binding-like beta-propeller repeat protein [Ktedonobacteraceae bacterium]